MGRPDRSLMDAAQNLVDMPVITSPAYRDHEIKAPRDGAHPDIVKFTLAFLRELKRRGIPMFPHEYMRGPERQNELRRKGRSKARFGRSAHNFGMAVDIVHFGRYWELTKNEWQVIGAVGKEVARRLNVKVTWGGDWRFYDPAHWELSDWKERVAAL